MSNSCNPLLPADLDALIISAVEKRLERIKKEKAKKKEKHKKRLVDGMGKSQEMKATDEQLAQSPSRSSSLASSSSIVVLIGFKRRVKVITTLGSKKSTVASISVLLRMEMKRRQVLELHGNSGKEETGKKVDLEQCDSLPPHVKPVSKKAKPESTLLSCTSGKQATSKKVNLSCS
jgi:hypothetical protein